MVRLIIKSEIRFAGSVGNSDMGGNNVRGRSTNVGIVR